MTEDIVKIDLTGAKSGPVYLRAAVALGVFDGVHAGHRKIIAEAVKLAAETGAVPMALTFLPHPRELLNPAQLPVLLIPFAERVRRLYRAGAVRVGCLNFNQALSQLSPEEFLSRLAGAIELTGISVGENFRFGNGGAGDRWILAEYCREHRLAFSAAPLERLSEEVVSSSAIRRFIASGQLKLAETMLGSPVTLCGKVVPGYHAATGKLSCPTANVEVTAGVLPPDGVYAASVMLEGKYYDAAINIGFGPTFHWQQMRRRLEVHLLDFPGEELYGRELTVFPLQFLREERTFGSVEELKKQIVCDLEAIRTICKNKEFQNE